VGLRRGTYYQREQVGEKLLTCKQLRCSICRCIFHK